MDLKKRQLDFVEKKRVSGVRSLENICFDFLFKHCKLSYFTEEEEELRLQLYCLVDEFLTASE